MGILTALMGRSEEVDLAALEALGRMSARDPRALTGEPAEAARVHLISLDPRVRHQAAIAVGRLRDTGSVSDLIGLLEDTDSRVRRSAHWALREITGLGLPPDARRWSQYLINELSWYEEQGGDLVSTAKSADTFAAVDALRQLSDHPFHRRSVTQQIASVTGHSDETVAAAACSAIARLGDPLAVQPLIAALRDPREPVRVAAWRALQSLTGESFDAEPESWESWASSY
jgi:HEAT repeat protein